MEARELTELPETHLAMELMMCKSRYDFGGDDAVAIEKFWRDRCACSSFMSYTSEVSLIPSHYLSKKKGGPTLAAHLRKLRWACHMVAATETWQDMATSVVDDVVASGLARQMFDQLDSGVPVPGWVRELLEAGLQGGRTCPRTSGVEAGSHKMQHENITAPILEYALIAEVRWVSGDEDLAAMRGVLEESVGRLQPEDMLLLGLDCEWSDRGPGPSIVQLSVLQLVFVIDVLEPTDATREFFRWIFKCERLVPLGFSFAQDTIRLDVLMGSGLYGASSSSIKVVDIQALAMQHMQRDAIPGLKAVCQAWLHRGLDKTYQCSDWDQRPLSAAQLQYAAADAAVLLDVAAAMGVTGRCRVQVRPPPAQVPR